MGIPSDRPSAPPSSRSRRKFDILVSMSTAMCTMQDQLKTRHEPVTMLVVGNNFVELQAFCETLEPPGSIVYRTEKEIRSSEDPRGTRCRVIWGEKALKPGFVRMLLQHPNSKIRTILATRENPNNLHASGVPNAEAWGWTSFPEFGDFHGYMSKPIIWPEWSARNADRATIIEQMILHHDMPEGMLRPTYVRSARMFLDTASTITGSDMVMNLVKAAHRHAVEHHLARMRNHKRERPNESFTPESFEVTGAFFIRDALNLHSSTRGPTLIADELATVN